MIFYKRFLRITTLIGLAFMIMLTYPERSYAQGGDEDWSKPVNLSKSGAATNPLIVRDTNNVFHVIWKDTIDGYKYAESVDGENWTLPVTVAFPFADISSQPVFKPDTIGLVHIFWRTNDNMLFYGQSLAYNLDYPASWKINLLADSILTFNVMIDVDNTIHLSYITQRDSTIGPAGIYYRQSRDSGSVWSPTLKLYESEYFRALSADNAHLQLTATGRSDTDKVYVVWDNRPQKRIFLTRSMNGGLDWSPVEEVDGPQDALNPDIPFNISVGAFDDKVLLMWQSGQLGTSRCNVYSRFSMNAGDDWQDSIKVAQKGMSCAESISFVAQNEDLFIALLNNQGNIGLIAWDGGSWSQSKTLNELTSFSDPLTFDTVFLGCQQYVFSNDKVFVVGCDSGVNQDIWFSSRSFETPNNWFSPPTGWGELETIVSTPYKIAFPASVADSNGNLHMVWAQSSSFGNIVEPSIQYVRWDGEKWSNPVGVITDLSGVPIHLSMTVDSRGRLLLTWVDGENGDILFSWANGNRAHFQSEWSPLQSLPSPSAFNSSPDILVDDVDRIVVAYAVPLNEKRGIYIVQSTDNGETWSLPILVFDASAAEWEMVDNPEIGLDVGGKLHLLLSRYSIRGISKPIGLYYLQSIDGGRTWSALDEVGNGLIYWSELIRDDEQVMHRLWQEENSTVFAHHDQVSQDGGITWSKSLNVTGVTDVMPSIALTRDRIGKLHFIQVYKVKSTLVIKDWQWDGSDWSSRDIEEIDIKSEVVSYSITAGITSNDLLQGFILLGYPEGIDNLDNHVFSIGKSFDLPENEQPISPIIIPSPADNVILIETPTLQPTINRDDVDSRDSTGTERSVMKKVGIIVFICVLLLFLWALYMKRKSR